MKLNLTLQSTKPVVLHGENGFSRKGSEPGEASYYMSYTRLKGNGSLRVGDKEHQITAASAWMDHEVVSYAAASKEIGWDWFAIQLESGQEVMLFHLRDSSGRPTRFSSGTFIDSTGSSKHLAREDFEITVLDYWTSTDTGIRYPIRWQITVPEKELDVFITPTLKHQEIESTATTGVVYWEGRSLVNGTLGAESITGNAYVELVGYAKGS